ncbi:MAG TPA: thioredoxin family protein [Chitinophaga sp.]|uniref:thioredoxin family protein n=1 Tax=Chitinophaga sp. TaxID=1869181 RepID=UPI002BDC7C68|nr:thioredoxin family protein [Chitinophaga sp.]HVI46890.1 thioredoxin family protein [Chitinophaga sp.]
METAVKFFTERETDEAFALAKALHKPVLIDYWATNCKGCEKMEAVTYQDEEVLEFLADHYVVVKCHVSNIDQKFRQTFLTTALLWSPSLFIYAPDGTILRTMMGYLPPVHFIAQLSIGRVLLLMRTGKHKNALGLLNNIPVDSYPELDQEAMYLAGVAAFFAGPKEFVDIAPHWKRLRDTYPDSVWAEKASVLPEQLYDDVIERGE